MSVVGKCREKTVKFDTTDNHHLATRQNASWVGMLSVASTSGITHTRMHTLNSITGFPFVVEIFHPKMLLEHYSTMKASALNTSLTPIFTTGVAHLATTTVHLSFMLQQPVHIYMVLPNASFCIAALPLLLK